MPESPQCIIELSKFEPEEAGLMELPEGRTFLPPREFLPAEHQQQEPFDAGPNTAIDAGYDHELQFDALPVDDMDWEYWNDLILTYEMQAGDRDSG